MLRVFKNIPNTVKAVGITSFLINMSTLMIFSIFGLYLHYELHIDFSKIGFLDGAVEFSAYIMKTFSGILSDFLKNRKILFLIGSIFLFVAKPLEATATKYWTLFQAKVLERIGNGIQSTPRDAIVGDWAPAEKKATCFGLRQSLAALGAVVGAVLSSYLLKRSGGNYQFVFWMATIPSFIAVLIIVLFVKDKKTKQQLNNHKPDRRKISFKDIKGLGIRYWILIGVACTYMVAKVSESIVIIYFVSSLGLSEEMAPLCMIFYQFANSFISLPAGVLSDKLKSRENVFILGIVIFIIADILFIFGGSQMSLMIFALICLGAYIGITQSIFPAKIIDVVPADLKGTGVGIFNLACAVSFLVGGSMFGEIAKVYTPRHSFIVSSGLAIFSLTVLFISKFINKRLDQNND